MIRELSNFQIWVLQIFTSPFCCQDTMLVSYVFNMRTCIHVYSSTGRPQVRNIMSRKIGSDRDEQQKHWVEKKREAQQQWDQLQYKPYTKITLGQGWKKTRHEAWTPIWPCAHCCSPATWENSSILRCRVNLGVGNGGGVLYTAAVG